MTKEIDYKKKYDSLKKRSAKIELSLREEIASDWERIKKLNNDISELKKIPSYKYSINIKPQEMCTSMSDAKSIAKKRVLLGITEQSLDKKGDSFRVEKKECSSFEFESFADFQKKVCDLIDAEVWFFKTKRVDVK